MNTKEKKWYKSRIIWVGVITAIIGVLTAIRTVYPDLGWIITVIGILNMILRLNTDSSII